MDSRTMDMILDADRNYDCRVDMSWMILCMITFSCYQGQLGFEPPKGSGDRRGVTAWGNWQELDGNWTGGQLEETMEIIVIIGSWMPDMMPVNLKWITLVSE